MQSNVFICLQHTDGGFIVTFKRGLGIDFDLFGREINNFGIMQWSKKIDMDQFRNRIVCLDSI